MTENTEKHDQKTFVIVVNGAEKAVRDRTLTFNQVVALADGLPAGPNVTYTVAYRKADQPRKEGTLGEGESVKIKDRTVFDVTATDKS
jgi:hypothetical protein